MSRKKEKSLSGVEKNILYINKNVHLVIVSKYLIMHYYYNAESYYKVLIFKH